MALGVEGGVGDVGGLGVVGGVGDVGGLGGLGGFFLGGRLRAGLQNSDWPGVCLPILLQGPALLSVYYSMDPG